MIVSLEGQEAVGKTTLAYSAPLPIVGFNFDMGIERALYGTKYEELFEGLSIEVVPYSSEAEPSYSTADILIYELPQPIQLDSIRIQGCRNLWSYFIIRLAKAFTDPKVRTIVVDTMTNARRIKADSFLEALQDKAYKPNGDRIPEVQLRERLQQIEYGLPNDAIRDIYTTGAGTRKNLIGVHHLTDEYAQSLNARGEQQSTPTGNKILEGLNNTYRFVDIALRMEKDKTGNLRGRWQKCGYDLSKEGTYLENPTWEMIVNLLEMSCGDRLGLEHRR